MLKDLIKILEKFQFMSIQFLIFFHENSNHIELKQSKRFVVAIAVF